MLNKCRNWRAARPASEPLLRILYIKSGSQLPPDSESDFHARPILCGVRPEMA